MSSLAAMVSVRCGGGRRLVRVLLLGRPLWDVGGPRSAARWSRELERDVDVLRLAVGVTPRARL